MSIGSLTGYQSAGQAAPRHLTRELLCDATVWTPELGRFIFTKIIMCGVRGVEPWISNGLRIF
jgi:hypothetical protein